jgi:hypothetical protein
VHCAGCTIKDELFASFEQVLAIADKNGVKYDRIVLENSGVAEPQNIRDSFADAAENGHPALSRVSLSTLVCFCTLNNKLGVSPTSSQDLQGSRSIKHALATRRLPRGFGFLHRYYGNEVDCLR